jgi:hypothetical protein
MTARDLNGSTVDESWRTMLTLSVIGGLVVIGIVLGYQSDLKDQNTIHLEKIADAAAIKLSKRENSRPVIAEDFVYAPPGFQLVVPNKVPERHQKRPNPGER